ncbi:replication protein A 70 kDa DNA-binding subunit B-like [Forsythia ovata]|uniref:Replication protein A 70 kDa DNA-binding subunit B-like n=1 Tax=Forsythia ovata TaxID=205694 RepID=A0ABD1WKE6_9LAMI
MENHLSDNGSILENVPTSFGSSLINYQGRAFAFNAGSKTSSVAGLAIDMLPKKVVQTKSGTEFYTKEVIFINERFETVMLRMWDRFVNNECSKIFEIINKIPVILGKKFRVSSFNGNVFNLK